MGREELEVSGDSLERQQQGVLTERTLELGQRGSTEREIRGVTPKRKKNSLNSRQPGTQATAAVDQKGRAGMQVRERQKVEKQAQGLGVIATGIHTTDRGSGPARLPESLEDKGSWEHLTLEFIP